MEYTLSLILTMCEALSLSLAADGMFTRKSKNAFKYYLIVCLSIVMLVALGMTFRSFPIIIKFLISIFIMFFMISINHNGVVGYKLLLCLVFFMVNSVLDYAVMSVYINFFSSTYSGLLQNTSIYIVSAFTSKLMLLISAFFFKKLRNTINFHGSNVTSSFAVSLLIIPIFSVFNIIFLFDSTIRQNEVSVWFFADAIGLLLCNIFIVFLWEKFDEDNRVRLENALLQQEIKNNMYNTLALEDLYKKQRILTHDFQNHALAIQGLLENNAIDEALNYVRDRTKREYSNKQMVSTNNQIVDIVLNQKYEDARRQDVIMSFLINDLSGIKIKDEDIVTILTNALDNAIEATTICTTGKHIRIKIMRRVGVNLLVSVRNSSNPVNIENDKIATTKANSTEHGFGLQNIKRMIKQYDGEFIVLYQDGWFQLTALLPETT